ncbi:monocopper oxidase-like protein SKU5 [Telopea speciosissima]|uniref:monocopper oxidase-like protein SKU5 n=1 Tax=Telopea speciosissima TaxID=54955 RepID=UPI001CC58719|nr:monocopper oxidase-like protein SKU5 [Telopea speciosissima]
MESIFRQLLLFLLIGFAIADNPHFHFDWTVSYTPLAPLGISKPVITINGQFPGPTLNATTNDILNINVRNDLPEPFLLTWNGVQQRRNSWQDGVEGTNCPIAPGKNWTYSFQVKDQIGSFFYFPSLLLQKASGGYGAVHINNRVVIPVPFSPPHQEFNVLIGDWYNADNRELRASLDRGNYLPTPDGILINGVGPYQTNFAFRPGATYRLRISNVGLKTSVNFRIQDHLMLLVETEGSYTLKQYYVNLDIHVGQSYSVLVTANQSSGRSYYMVATSRFIIPELAGIAIIQYPGSQANPIGPFPPGPGPFDFRYSMEQARSIRWDLSVGAARPNPQGSFHYGQIHVSQNIILENDMAIIGNHQRYTVNGISFVHPDTPLKLADYFQLNDVFNTDSIPKTPDGRYPALGTSVIDLKYRNFIHIVFQNPLPILQTWHIDGYNFFVVGMDEGNWDDSRRSTYNLVDAISRSTIQVYPNSWTAIMVELDNQGMWNVRSQEADKWYLGQELYIRVKGVGQDNPSTIPIQDEAPIPANVIRCGRAGRFT